MVVKQLMFKNKFRNRGFRCSGNRHAHHIHLAIQVNGDIFFQYGVGGNIHFHIPAELTGQFCFQLHPVLLNVAVFG